VDAFRSGRVSAVDMHHNGYFLSIGVTEQCMDENWHWPLKELAKCTGFHTDTDELSSNHRTQSTTTDTLINTEILSPSYIEVCPIINKLKSNKAGGTDSIIPKLIKLGGRTLKQRIYRTHNNDLGKRTITQSMECRNNLPVVQEEGQTGLHELQTYNIAKCCI
jgi:hypothetical protein